MMSSIGMTVPWLVWSRDVTLPSSWRHIKQSLRGVFSMFSSLRGMSQASGRATSIFQGGKSSLLTSGCL